MALPKLDVPTYEVNLISTGKPVRFRPFLVKEQKLFLMASESEDANEIVKTIRQVLKNCLLDEVDVDNLPTFDLEFLFMNLRARSVEEVVELQYKCNNNVKDDEGHDKKCNGVVNFKMNLLEINPTKDPNHTNKVQITENLGICFKYPTFEMIQKYDDMNENQVMMNILVDCIDYIYDQDNIYYAKDTPRKELEEFVDNLQQKDVEKFEKFFDTLPEIKRDVHFKCPKCGYEEDITIKGMQNFFV
jgi:DNA-directed RNA polymerase subunit M/transcription elongation factor TFIIS